MAILQENKLGSENLLLEKHLKMAPHLPFLELLVSRDV